MGTIKSAAHTDPVLLPRWKVGHTGNKPRVLRHKWLASWRMLIAHHPVQVSLCTLSRLWQNKKKYFYEVSLFWAR